MKAIHWASLEIVSSPRSTPSSPVNFVSWRGSNFGAAVVADPGDAPLRRGEAVAEGSGEDLVDGERGERRGGEKEKESERALHAFAAMFATFLSSMTQLPWKIAPSSMISAGVCTSQ